MFTIVKNEMWKNIKNKMKILKKRILNKLKV